jgi:outer membrane protein OmpU
MNKFLTGAAAALLGVGLAAPAYAQDDMDMTGVAITGALTQDIGIGSYVGKAESADDLHFQTDSEIKFVASGQTDGGLMVTATIEMDTDSSGAIDESNLAIAGGFGKIILGSDDNAANMLGNKGIGNGYAGTGYYNGGENYTLAGSAGALGGGDGLGIRYLTPTVAGFQAGASFQVEHGDPDGGSTGVDNDQHVIAFGANFSGDFAGTSLTIGTGWISRDPGGASDEDKSIDLGIGVSVGIGTTSMNVRYDIDTDGNSNDTASYGVGIDHGIGALTFGIGYGSSTDADDLETTVISGGGKYDLSGGVVVQAAVTSGEVGDLNDVGLGMRIALSF